jgi:hypothetical protein
MAMFSGVRWGHPCFSRYLHTGYKTIAINNPCRKAGLNNIPSKIIRSAAAKKKNLQVPIHKRKPVWCAFTGEKFSSGNHI